MDPLSTLLKTAPDSAAVWRLVEVLLRHDGASDLELLRALCRQAPRLAEGVRVCWGHGDWEQEGRVFRLNKAGDLEVWGPKGYLRIAGADIRIIGRNG